MPAKTPPPLHELEAEVMEELWRSGEASVRSVMEALNKPRKKDRAYTTYMTILSRLHRKGALERRREASASRSPARAASNVTASPTAASASTTRAAALAAG